MWNGCNSPHAGGEYGSVPLCVGHVYETWRIARDLADRRENHNPTVEVRMHGELATVERPVTKLGWIY